MPFGFKNQVIFGSINFRQDHMEKDRTQMDGFEAAVCADLEKIRTDGAYARMQATLSC